MKLSEVAKIVNGELIGHDAHFYGASSDTRLIKPGQLFFAWKGEQHDGHDFLERIETNGAIAAVVERFIPSANIAQIVVKDSQKALGSLAKTWRKQWKGTLVALTGSNGKTTVKEMLYSIFSQADITLATKGNLNNHVGCPLTLLGLSEQHHYAVIEMGANHPKEIAYLTKIAQPDIALLNNAGACHLEGFGSLQGVAEAKAEIFQGLSATGTAIINADDAFCNYWKSCVKENRILTFGLQNSADVRAIEITDQQFILKTHDYEVNISLQLEGMHNVLNAAAAAAAAIAAGISLTEIKKGLEALVPVAGRLQKITLKSGVLLINDGYNANPNSLKAGIDAQNPAAERWLVLGDMKELGPEAVALHHECGIYAKKKGFSRLLAIGNLAKQSSDAFGEGGESFETKGSLLLKLNHYLMQAHRQPLVILVKGSNSMNMQFFIDQLIKE